MAAAVRHLETGIGFAHRADERMALASLVKLPAMAATYVAAHAGAVRLDKPSHARGHVRPGVAETGSVSW
ncbi:MAG: serine hydrolase [Pirellulales bacterium]